MVLQYLRDDVSLSQSFTVSELPHDVKLDQNESPFDLPADLKEFLSKKHMEHSWNRYPQPAQYFATKKAFGDVLGIKPENIFLAAGCDQVIQAMYFVAGGRGKKALVFEPVYPMFPHAGKFTQTELDIVNTGPETSVSPNLVTDIDHDIVFIVAPGNPTGLMPEEGTVEQALKNDAMVFVDEAYYNFSNKTFMNLIDQHPNLFIARSVSKSCLAGIRLGYGVGHPDVISAMESVLTAPYHIGLFQLTVAENFDTVRPVISDICGLIVKERERLFQEFDSLKISSVPSSGNFIMFKVDAPDNVFQGLAEAGVRIRSLNAIPGLSGYVRVTVGTKEENDLFLAKLKAVVA